MKKITLALLALTILIISCGSAGSEKATSADSAKKETAVADTSGNPPAGWDNTANWKTISLEKDFKMPLQLFVPANSVAQKSGNNSNGVQVSLDDIFGFYEIAPDESASVAEAIKSQKETTPIFAKDFKVEKEDPNGFIYTYSQEPDGKTCRSLYYAKEVGGKIYGISLAGVGFAGPPEQIQKLYDGLKK